MQHFYPYFDVVKSDWPAELRRALTSAATDLTEVAFTLTLRRLVAALHDGHGYVSGHEPISYFPPCGWDWIENQLVVTRTAANGATDLKPGDVVSKVNGVPAADAIAAREEFLSSATPQLKRHRSLPQLAAGPKDSEVTLEILRPMGKTEKITVRRTLDGEAYGQLDATRPAQVAEIKPGIFYVDLERIKDKGFAEALPQLEKAKGIIFDMRGYPGQLSSSAIGHLTDKPVTCAQWHIPITLYPDRQHVTFAFSNWEVAPKKPRFSAKVAFLTDGRAISYAETWMGIIEHYRLAAIVGTPTAGTNGNVNPVSLPGGYQVMWTGMKVLKHDGSPHHGVGILPTEPVQRTIKGIAEGRDEILERAIEVVGR